MRKACCLAVALLAPVWAWAQTTDTGPQGLTPETMWSLERLGPPTLSPDGRHAVAAVTRFDVKEDKGLTDLWLFATDGSGERQLTTHSSGDANPLFSPDGQWLAFVAQREEDKAPQLYVLPMAGGEARRVTQVPTGIGAFKWYGDSQRLAFISRVWPELSWEDMGKRLKERAESKMTARVWDSGPVTSWDVFVDDRQAHLYAVAIAGGEPQALTLKSGYELPRSVSDASSFDVNPKTGVIAFVADSNPATDQLNLDVFLLADDGSSARNLSAGNEAGDSNPQFSPDGKRLAYARQHIRGFYGDTRRLVLHELASDQTRIWHQDWDRSADGLVWQPDGRGFYASIDDAGVQRLYEIPLREGRAPRPITGDENFSAVAVSADGKRLVALRESYSEPGTLVRVDPRNGEATKISTRNDATLAQVNFGRYESVTYPGANGVDIQMWVVYPPNFDSSKRWPLFLLLHGGPHNGITNAFSYRWNAQVFAAQGYVVAWHNFHGSSGFGQAFTDSINPKQDELPYTDTIKAAEWFAAKPWIDPQRMVAGGGSYGGYLASILLGREHPFKALIAHAAVYNWYTQIGSDFGFLDARFKEFWEDPSVFQQSSPHFGAGNFNTPTLVIHGQLDYRVPVNHGIELYQTLKKRGVESRLIYYPNENHWILKPQNSLFWYQQVHDWVKKYAAPGPG